MPVDDLVENPESNTSSTNRMVGFDDSYQAGAVSSAGEDLDTSRLISIESYGTNGRFARPACSKWTIS
jgi:hypothetical protein